MKKEKKTRIERMTEKYEDAERRVGIYQRKCEKWEQANDTLLVSLDSFRRKNTMQGEYIDHLESILDFFVEGGVHNSVET